MKELFLKYVKNECSEEELREIVLYFQRSKDFSEVPSVETIYRLLEEFPEMEKATADKMGKTILEKARKDQRSRRWKYVVAAVVVIGLALAHLLKNTGHYRGVENTGPIIVNNQIEPGVDKATLTLEDGSEVKLVKGKSILIGNAKSNGETVEYDKSSHSHGVSYNYITVPRGGHFKLTLSDGTRVWLNSETRLKYPVSFNDGESRVVELLFGEAYFDVSPSVQHMGSNFKVMHEGQEVKVLGTEFNIKAYDDEANIYTTLAEGVVEIHTEDRDMVLMPGEQANYDVSTKKLDVYSVDVYDQVSWKDGVFSFKKMPLKDIMRTLSRWYDMKVDFENQELQAIGFNGVLGKEQDIEEILETIKGFGVINTYEIKNRHVIIK